MHAHLRILLSLSILLALALACSGGPRSNDAAGPHPPAPKAGATPAPVATGLGSNAQPRSCNTRVEASKCRQLRPAYFDPKWSMTDDLAEQTCQGAAGTYQKVPCPTEGLLGHCITEVEDILYYQDQYTPMAASMDCTTFAQGTWTAAP